MKLNIILLLVLLIQCFSINNELFFVVLFYLFLLDRTIIISKNEQYRSIGITLFLVASLVSLFFCKIYLDVYNLTFAPFYDDSLYYLNSLSLSKFEISLIPPTLFEVLLAVVQYVYNLIIGESIAHLYLLPINWFLSALSGIYLLKIVMLLNIKIKTSLLVFFLPLLLNFNFLDTVSHLYRDSLIVFLSFLFIYYTFKDKFKTIIVLFLLVFLLRGANAILLLFLFFMYYFIVKKKYSIVKTTLYLMLPSISLVFALQILGSSVLRGGFGSTENNGFQETLEKRLEYNTDASSGGSSELRRGGIASQIVYPFIYTFSPFITNSETPKYEVIHAGEGLYIYGSSIGEFSFPLKYKLPYLLHLLTIGFFIYPVIKGIQIAIKSNDARLKILAIYFIVFIILVSIVSMQARHRLTVVYLFPLFYSLYFFASKKQSTKFSFLVGLVLSLLIFLVNVFINL